MPGGVAGQCMRRVAGPDPPAARRIGWAQRARPRAGGCRGPRGCATNHHSSGAGGWTAVAYIERVCRRVTRGTNRVSRTRGTGGAGLRERGRSVWQPWAFCPRSSEPPGVATRAARIVGVRPVAEAGRGDERQNRGPWSLGESGFPEQEGSPESYPNARLKHGLRSSTCLLYTSPSPRDS